MTDLLRKDNAAVPERSNMKQQSERNDQSTTESRTLVTPPPSDYPSASVASSSATGTAAVRVSEERVALFTSNEAADRTSPVGQHSGGVCR